MSSSIWLECLSKNCVWNPLGMGLNILGGGSEVVDGSLAMSVFGGFVDVWVGGQSFSWVCRFVIEVY